MSPEDAYLLIKGDIIIEVETGNLFHCMFNGSEEELCLIKRGGFPTETRMTSRSKIIIENNGTFSLFNHYGEGEMMGNGHTDKLFYDEVLEE